MLIFISITLHAIKGKGLRCPSRTHFSLLDPLKTNHPSLVVISCCQTIFIGRYYYTFHLMVGDWDRTQARVSSISTEIRGLALLTRIVEG